MALAFKEVSMSRNIDKTSLKERSEKKRSTSTLFSSSPSREHTWYRKMVTPELFRVTSQTRPVVSNVKRVLFNTRSGGCAFVGGPMALSFSSRDMLFPLSLCSAFFVTSQFIFLERGASTLLTPCKKRTSRKAGELRSPYRISSSFSTHFLSTTGVKDSPFSGYFGRGG